MREDLITDLLLPNTTWVETLGLKEAEGHSVLRALAVFIDLEKPMVGVKHLAKATRKSQRSVRKHLKSLEQRGYIEVTPQYHEDNPLARTYNLYALKDPRHG